MERKVDDNRANLFIPATHFNKVKKYDQKLLACHEKKASELHYKNYPLSRNCLSLLMLPQNDTMFAVTNR